MKNKHVSEVKRVIGQQAVQVLTDIFRCSNGVPPGVAVARYRADHSHWIEVIDRLVTPTLFLERDRENKNYLVRVYGLPLIEDDHAKALLGQMEEAFQFFKSEYKIRLDKPIDLKEIVAALNVDPGQVNEMLCYMMHSHDIWCGLSGDFPFGESPIITISEQVLRHQHFEEILSQFYEWHIINPISNQPREQFKSPFLDNEGFFSLLDGSLKPSWFEVLDQTKKDLILEIDEALKKGLTALPTMGLRTLIDLVLVEHVGDAGTFPEKLSAFEGKGIVSVKDKESIYRVLEAGNAATHRAHFPDRADLLTCRDVIKHMMHGVYELHPRTEILSKNTPKRLKAGKAKSEG